MPTFNDYEFGKAYQAEILRQAEAARLAKKAYSAKLDQSEVLSIKDRFLLSAGNLLISYGWKIRRASSYPYSCPEPKRV